MILYESLNDLKDRALRTYHKMKQQMGLYIRKYPLLTMKLFQSVVQPILLYGSDFFFGGGGTKTAQE